jgi:hypothetical protein
MRLRASGCEICIQVKEPAEKEKKYTFVSRYTRNGATSLSRAHVDKL